MARNIIDTPQKLIDWRQHRGLSQQEAMKVFHRKRRAFQNIEAGKHKDFPADIDDLAMLYDIIQRRKKK